jgi:hypothetical protein
LQRQHEGFASPSYYEQVPPHAGRCTDPREHLYEQAWCSPPSSSYSQLLPGRLRSEPFLCCFPARIYLEVSKMDLQYCITPFGGARKLAYSVVGPATTYVTACIDMTILQHGLYIPQARSTASYPFLLRRFHLRCTTSSPPETFEARFSSNLGQ